MAAKLKQFDCIGECLEGFWEKDKWANPIRKVIKRGRKLSRQQFMRRTREHGREYAEQCAKARVEGFQVSKANYREGQANGEPVVVMAVNGLAWLFVDRPEVNIWGGK